MGTKPFFIRKQQVMQAYRLVKANAGDAGVDQQSLEGFERKLKDNLYKIWNRMSSGSYFPPPIRSRISLCSTAGLSLHPDPYPLKTEVPYLFFLHVEHA